MTIRVLICDDRALIRDAMARALSAVSDFVVAAVGSLDDAISVVAHEPPDVVVIDDLVDTTDRLRLIRWFHANHPQCASILLTSHPDDDLLVAAYSASVAALITDNCDCTVLVERIRDVAVGLRFISAEDARAACHRLQSSGRVGLDQFDDIDRQIADLIAAGYRDREIAAIVHLSANTVRNRVSRMLRALGLTSRVELAVLVTRAGRGLRAARPPTRDRPG